jgi:hypothetical protein
MANADVERVAFAFLDIAEVRHRRALRDAAGRRNRTGLGEQLLYERSFSRPRMTDYSDIAQVLSRV